MNTADLINCYDEIRKLKAVNPSERTPAQTAQLHQLLHTVNTHYGSLVEKPLISNEILIKAKYLVKIPREHGHGDIGEILVGVLKGEYDEDEALTELEFFRQDYEDDERSEN